MKKKVIDSSELIINDDGSVFHLHLLPEQVADKVILVGDPGRVDIVAQHFENKECRVSNREFCSVTGSYKGKRITVISTGIGCDNIDIVLNEIDALVNVDFATRTVKDEIRSLEIVRIGTCGGLQRNTPEGTFVASSKSIGFDGLLNFYAGRDSVAELDIESEFLKHMGWTGSQCIAHPYVVSANNELIARIAPDMVQGMTIACGGFYAPQGRMLRLPIADPMQNEKIMAFEYGGLRITNFEMESSALAGLSLLMGHKALTCCMVVANRVQGKSNPSYKNSIDSLILTVLERI